MDYIVEGQLTKDHMGRGQGGSAWGCPLNLAIRDALRTQPVPHVDPNTRLCVEVGYYIATLHPLTERGLLSPTIYGALLPVELHGYPLALEQGRAVLPVEFMLVFVENKPRQP